mgnify:CR=1 FL=1
MPYPGPGFRYYCADFVAGKACGAACEFAHEMPPSSAAIGGGGGHDDDEGSSLCRPTVSGGLGFEDLLATPLALERAGLEYQLICEPDSCQDAPLCRWLKPERMNQAGRVRAELEEAIATLERTRHAFRSRQLADLRYRLQGLLRTASLGGAEYSRRCRSCNFTDSRSILRFSDLWSVDEGTIGMTS